MEISLPLPLSFFSLTFIFEREKERVGGGRGRERGRHRIWSRLQALSCQHRAWHGPQMREPQDHDLNQSWMLDGLSHQAPLPLSFKIDLLGHLGLGSGHDLMVCEIKPHVRLCTVQSLLGILSLSFCPSSGHALSRARSKEINNKNYLYSLSLKRNK